MRLVLGEPSTALTREQASRIKRNIRARLLELSISGYCLCLDCGATNSRESDDHGQPDFCAACKSTRLRNVAPGETVQTVAHVSNRRN